MRSTCLVSSTWRSISASTSVGQLDGIGHQHRGRQRIVFGLADQVGGDVHRVGAGVGEHGDLGRSGFGVDADHAAQQPLGRGDVDIAGAGDDVDRLDAEGGVAVGEQRDGLGTADGVHLVDAQQRAGGQDRRVRQAAELLLGRRADDQRLDARDLRRHHVHHDAGRVDRQAARDVQADAADRDPPFGDRAARHHIDADVLAALGLVDDAGAADRLGQRVAHGRIELVERLLQRRAGNARLGDVDPVEAQRRLPRGGVPALGDCFDDRRDRRERGLDIDPGPRQDAPRVGRSGGGQVDTSQHAPILRGPHSRIGRPPFPGRVLYRHGMSDRGSTTVALFPLDVVLLPGSALPLHIFEPRYRSLLSDVCAPGGPRAFGVISLRHGPPAAGDYSHGELELAEVGTMAEVIEVDPYPDGRSDLLTIGSRRFRLLDVDENSQPYLRGQVEWLDENDGDITPEHVAAARVLCRRYCGALAAASGREPPEDDLSDDPLRLSYQIAARIRLPGPDRQRLLEAETAAARLYDSIAVLRQETALLTSTRTVPVSPHVLRVSSTSN